MLHTGWVQAQLATAHFNMAQHKQAEMAFRRCRPVLNPLICAPYEALRTRYMRPYPLYEALHAKCGLKLALYEALPAIRVLIRGLGCARP